MEEQADDLAGPGDGPGWQRIHDSMLEIMRAADEHFGNREPSDSEVREFIRGRLVEQGKSAEEADAILADL